MLKLFMTITLSLVAVTVGLPFLTKLLAQPDWSVLEARLSEISQESFLETATQEIQSDLEIKAPGQVLGVKTPALTSTLVVRSQYLLVAGIDTAAIKYEFDPLATDSATQLPAPTLTVILPPATIKRALPQPDKTQLLSQDRGLFNWGEDLSPKLFPYLHAEAQRLTQAHCEGLALKASDYAQAQEYRKLDELRLQIVQADPTLDFEIAVKVPQAVACESSQLTGE